MRKNPIFDQVLNNRARQNESLNSQYKNIHIALRFPEYDKYIPNCHLTLKHYNKVQGLQLFNHAIELEEFLPVALFSPRSEKWEVSTKNGPTYYEGFVFDREDNPGLFQHINMPHITVPNGEIKGNENDISFLLFEAEWIADRVYIGQKDSTGKSRYYDLMEFFLNA